MIFFSLAAQSTLTHKPEAHLLHGSGQSVNTRQSDILSSAFAPATYTWLPLGHGRQGSLRS